MKLATAMCLLMITGCASVSTPVKQVKKVELVQRCAFYQQESKCWKERVRIASSSD